MATYYTWELYYNRRRNPTPMQCTFGQLKEMCVLMSQELPGYSFSPEKISEGGVEITNWPGKTSERAFKTFRLLSTRNYPWVDDSTPDDSIFTMPHGDKRYFNVKLKAFYGAPPFTTDEMMAFRNAFENTIFPQNGWRLRAMISATTANNPNNW